MVKAFDTLAELAVFKGVAEEFRENAVARLSELVELESPSGDVAKLDELRDSLRSRWEHLGLEVRINGGSAGDHLVAFSPSTTNWAGAPSSTPAGHLLFVGHYDTVWPVGELARQPFAIDDDRASGPGVFDMKASLVAFETAQLVIQRMGATPARQFRFVCTADEEVSSVDGRRVVLEQAEGALAVIGLEPPHPDGGFKNGRRGVARVLLKVTGREAHSGLDAKMGVSAIDEMVDQLVALRHALPMADDAACNVGRINGGSRANVIAGDAEAEIGFRFKTRATELALLDAVESLVPLREGATIERRILAHRPAWEASTDTWLVDHVLATSAAQGDVTNAKPANGAGDTNFTGSIGIPTLDGLGPRGAGAHARGEYVELNSMFRRAELYAALICAPIQTPQL
jgi:glutamate carboxypeptidase